MADPTPTRLDTVDPSISLDTAATRFRERLLALCPASRAQSLALTRLDECLMWAKAGVVRVVPPALALLLALALPTIAFAQAAAPSLVVDPNAPIPSVWGILLGLLALMIPAVVGGLRWGGGLIAKQIELHVENEFIRGALQRLLGEIYRLADLVGGPAQSLILKARAPDSPGGAEVTRAELDDIARGIIDALARGYGGWPQLFELLARVGLGETEAEVRAALTAHVEAAVARKLGETVAPSGPR